MEDRNLELNSNGIDLGLKVRFQMDPRRRGGERKGRSTLRADMNWVAILKQGITQGMCLVIERSNIICSQIL